MASQGPLAPANAEGNWGGGVLDPGGADWTNAANAKVANGSGASCTNMGAFTFSAYLKSNDYGFSVPETATVNGVVAQAGISSNTSNSYDKAIQLFYFSATGTNHARGSGSTWPLNSYSLATWGSSTDLWGIGISPSMVNNSSFGFMVAVQNGSSNGAFQYVDYMTMTVYYTALGAAGVLRQTAVSRMAGANGLIMRGGRR